MRLNPGRHRCVFAVNDPLIYASPSPRQNKTKTNRGG